MELELVPGKMFAITETGPLNSLSTVSEELSRCSNSYVEALSPMRMDELLDGYRSFAKESTKALLKEAKDKFKGYERAELPYRKAHQDSGDHEVPASSSMLRMGILMLLCSTAGRTLATPGLCEACGRSRTLLWERGGEVPSVLDHGIEADFDRQDAEVLCRELGCRAPLTLQGALFGEGELPYGNKEFQCRGTDYTRWHSQGRVASNGSTFLPSLSRAWRRETGGWEQSLSWSVGDVPQWTLEELVRLGKQGSRCGGEVQVFDKGRWRRLKAYMWTLKEAAVVCQQLDCGSAVAAMESELEGDEVEMGVYNEVYRFPVPTQHLFLHSHKSIQGPPEVFRVHGFSITCSTQPQYPGGSFHLKLPWDNRSHTQTIDTMEFDDLNWSPEISIHNLSSKSGSLALVITGVLSSRISGAEVEMRVRPGDNVTLYSDCVWKVGFSTVWFRNCSHQHQPPLIMLATAQEHHARLQGDVMQKPLPRYFIVWNSSSSAHDLLVKNVSESDLGLYYCTLYEKKITEDKPGRGVWKDIYHYGNRTTQLFLLGDTTVPCAGSLQTTSTPPVSDCSVCWKLLISVCPVCVVLSSICVYCTYRYTTKAPIFLLLLDMMCWKCQLGTERIQSVLPAQVNTTEALEGLSLCSQLPAEGDSFRVQPVLPVEGNTSMSLEEVSLCYQLPAEDDNSVLFSRISGSEVEMRVRPGDNVVLYCDCVVKPGTFIVWFRKSSDEDQTPLIISADKLIQPAFSRHHFIENPSINTRDLLVRNVSESDLGLYYCALWDRKSVKGVQRDVYHNGTRTTRLSLLELPLLFQTPLFLVLIPPPPSRPPPPLLYQTVVSAGSCWSVCVQGVFSSAQSCPPPVFTGSAERGQKVLEREEDHSLTVCYSTPDMVYMVEKPLLINSTFSCSGSKESLENSGKHREPKQLDVQCEGVLFSRISGAEVEMRVRPGDNVVLYCDCVLKAETFIVWFRKSSDEDQTPLIISADKFTQPAFSCHHFIENPSINTRDLLVTNVSESDLGLYHCAVWDRKSVKGVQRDVYHNGARTTRLALLDPPVPCADPPETPSTLQTPSTPPVSDCRVCWKLLVSVCPVGVLLSSVVSSTCVYWIYRKRTEAVKEENPREREKSPNQQIKTREEVGGGDVCYAALDLPSRGQKPLKKKKRRVESSEFSTYSESPQERPLHSKGPESPQERPLNFKGPESPQERPCTLKNLSLLKRCSLLWPFL
ncbi:hypothetical protein NFI96_005460 [Prochilodus magdalenae]|nr:hypothetical protein NFI96_005460 [Prochilodus magdalenae]